MPSVAVYGSVISGARSVSARVAPTLLTFIPTFKLLPGEAENLPGGADDDGSTELIALELEPLRLAIAGLGIVEAGRQRFGCERQFTAAVHEELIGRVGQFAGISAVGLQCLIEQLVALGTVASEEAVGEGQQACYQCQQQREFL